MAESNFQLSFPEPDIAALTFDLPGKGANILSRHVLDELSTHLDELQPRRDLAGLIIRSGKPSMFIAGADLREFAASFDVPSDDVVALCTRGRTLFARLSNCPFVTVVAIDGICVGGGAELAVWCDRRIMSNNDKTQFGFPEVKLGLFPGWGGTVRAPRIVGLYNAVEMITSGDSIDAATAVLTGYATDTVDAGQLDEAAVRLVRAEQESGQYLKDRERWSAPIEISETELGFLGATASGFIQQQTKGHYPAPLAALEVLMGGSTVDADTAGEMEAAGMADLFGSPINRALINVFFLTDRNKKDTGLAGKDVAPADIKSVSVIGSGIMGQGIAGAALRRKIPAALTDANPEALARGVQQVLEEVSYNKKIKGPDVQRTIELGPLLNATASDDEIAASDLVIEAVLELADVKRQVFARLEPKMRDDAILATNTSTIPITTLATDLARPDRFAGLHFFNPVRKMPLVEVIRGEQTSDETVATLVAYAKRIGKSPIVVGDGPGFLVNRLLLPYMTEAAQLLIEGATPKQVDRAATAFGMPMGPINLYDVVGMDVAIHAGATMLAAFPDRVIASPLVQNLVKAGRLGKKSGRGFYSYENKKGRPEPDAALDGFLEPLQQSKNEFSAEQLSHRLFLPMLLEATRVLEEKLVRDARDVDLGLIFGTAFPPFKGGLLCWADTIGASQIIEMLKPYESLGKRYEPTDLLKEMAESGSTFYN
jgi:3-hydroxyacyl-CoA dehydrogenase/enoyl-CoA hydratase/3-hydroxybutyryl-CoA epimerase/3-hydroxyacyl-CoA dehydrogenase/enoyl-CoA hydratase/3-hydroxybutyryl-CoA epimerase/enoyl-CoA isomerase